jgi:hypothetical protein
MAVMMISDTIGQTRQGYDGLGAVLIPLLKSAKGFVLHSSHAIEGGWRVIEIWETRDDATRFFATAVAPHLPDGIRPKLTFTPLHDLVEA